MHTTFWSQVSMAFGVTPILPLLETVVFQSFNSNRHVDMGTMCLLKPSVQAITIEFRAVDDRIEEPLRDSFSVCLSSVPHLQKLSLALPVSLLDVTLLPQTHSNLRQLRIDTPCFPHHLGALAGLSCLEDLSMPLRGLVNSPVHFGRLDRLGISSFEWIVLEALFAHMDAPRLRALSITTNMDGSNTLRDDCASCMRAVSAKFPYLTGFHWRYFQTFARKMGYFGDTNVGSPLAELIEPLFALRNLRSFSYYFLGPVVPLSSRDMERIAEAWPDLEVFRLHQENDWNYHFDFASIISLARRCSRIHTLHLPRVQFNPISDNATVLPQDRLGLRELSIGWITYPPGSDSDSPAMTDEELRRRIQEVFPWIYVKLPYHVLSTA